MLIFDWEGCSARANGEGPAIGATLIGESVGFGTSSNKVERVAREPKEETAGIKGKKFDSKNAKVVEELI